MPGSGARRSEALTSAQACSAPGNRSTKVYIICCCKRPTKNSMNAPFLFNPLNTCFRRTHLQLPPWSTTALAVQAVVERKIVNSGWMSQIRVRVKTQSLREPLETLDVDARCWRKPSKHAYIDTYQNMVVRLEENTEVVIVS